MRPRWSVPFAVAAVLAGVIVGTASATGPPGPRVVVERGQPVRVVMAIDPTGVGAPFAEGIRNAVQLAADRQGSIGGFPIELIELAAPCGADDAAAEANAAVARTVVADPQVVGVIGHMCSAPVVGALPIYEAAGVVSISGSASRPNLPDLAPTTFNRTVVNDDVDFDSWYGVVRSTPVNLRWRIEYERRFGSPPTDYADLYFDAAAILLQRLERVARSERGRLVIDRAALARAVRGTRGFPGATCAVTLDPTTGNRVYDLAALGRCGGAIVTDRRIDDLFLGQSVNPALWWVGANQPGLTVVQGSGAVTITVPATGSDGLNAGLALRCKAQGDFDARLAFHLVDWPVADGIWVSLMASDTGGFNVYRATVPWGDRYGAYLPPGGAEVPASGDRGTLRLVRQGSTMTGYYLAGPGRWVSIFSGPGPTADVAFNASVFNVEAAPFGHLPATIAFDAFHLTADGVVCQ